LVLKSAMNFASRSGCNAWLSPSCTCFVMYALISSPILEVSVRSIKCRMAASFAGSTLSALAASGNVVELDECAATPGWWAGAFGAAGVAGVCASSGLPKNSAAVIRTVLTVIKFS